ncbi:MAG TPA: hypothetical protein VLC09_14460, partial [Polyangiaceae bacterium]|nr:hypothetical protein [Polyangiaceae bacterium]
RGALGIFYGGQLQELNEIGWTPEHLPTLGFALDFAEGDPSSRVRYEVTRPGPLGRRVTELTSLERPAGRRRLEQRIPLDAQAPLGTWNVRVSVDERLIVDRAFVVVGLRNESP